MIENSDSSPLFSEAFKGAVSKDYRTVNVVKEKIIKLQELIRYHDMLYYDKEAPEISDAEYDNLRKQLQKYKEEYPEFFEKEEGGDVGFTPSSRFAKSRHLRPMLSLDNAFTLGDMQKFLDKLEGFLSAEMMEQLIFTSEYKLDGLSFSAVYENGSLIRALTRGNGEIGEDVTNNIKVIEGLPVQIDYSGLLEVRGEVFMTKNDFQHLNDRNETTGLPMFANPRNAASGSLRQLDVEITRSRHLKYMVWGLQCDNIKCQSDALSFARKLGFVTVDLSLCIGLQQMQQKYKEALNARADIAYDIDGLVYKIDSYVLQNVLGETGRSPRWAIAYKFPAEVGITHINAVKFQVGRTGVITPVAELQPLNLGGVLVSRASLYNKDEIEKKDLRIGDYVQVKRSGDVIPKVISSIPGRRSGFEKSIIFPDHCPSCGSQIVALEGEVALRCTNVKLCKAQLVERLKYFVSQDGLDIEGLGARNIEEFVEMRLISNFHDIFLLPEHNKEARHQLQDCDGWGKKSVDNLFAAIEHSKTVALDKFLTALGIRFIGEGVAKLIARNFITFEALYKSYQDDTYNTKMQAIDGIGIKAQQSLYNYFSDHDLLQELLKLCEVLTILPFQEIVQRNGVLNGKKVVFTGNMQSMMRRAAKIFAEKNGAIVQSSISKNTDLLIVGEKPGSKIKKAQELGVKILTEQQWLALVNDAVK